MTIHIFIAHMGVGGAERVCVNLANEFAQNGHEVHIVVLNLDNDINTHLLYDSIHVHSLGVSRLRYSPIAMIQYIKSYKPSFIFVFGNEMAVILSKVRAMHLISISLIVRVLNNIDISLSKEDHISPLVEKYLKQQQKQLHHMEHVISQCDGMRNMLLEHKLVEGENITTIYNPVSSDLIRKTGAIRIPFANRDKNRLREIVFIGRIDPQKNLSHLLFAFSKVHQQYPSTVLRMVGDGNVMDEIRNLTISLRIENAVIFEGIVKDMERIYASADIVALSSEYEGMPNCLIEAIGCGIPIVSYDCPLGPSEIVQDGVNGFLVEYNNKEQLVNRLKESLLYQWDEETIRQTAWKFNVKQIAKQYIQIFERYC